MLVALPVRAFNLLVNPSFEVSPTGHNSLTNVATGWTYFSPPTPAGYFGDYWVQSTGVLNGVTVFAHSGNFFWKEWFVYQSTNNVAGIYQTFSSSSGSTYQASGWLFINSGDVPATSNTVIWLQVEFLDSSSNLLALYKSANFSINAGLNTWIQYQVTNLCDLTQPVATGDPFFNTYAITGAVNQIVAPVATASVRYRYCYLAYVGAGGSSYLDDADLEQLTGPIPPIISSLNPQNEIFVPPASGITFNVSSPSGHNINTNSIRLILNGTDVSSGLAFSGTNYNWNVTYSALQSNTTYNVSITATDSFNFAVSANTYFQTTWVGVPAYTYLWEAEDWDFSSNYLDTPDLCNTSGQPNCYFGKFGVQNVDEFSTSVPPTQFYRDPSDGIGTIPSGDYSRPNQVAANRFDYRIDPFNGNAAYDTSCEWVDYTRDWPKSTNWIIGRFANGATLAGTIQLSVVNPGVSTNVVGVFSMNPGPSWSTFQFAYLQGTNGDGQKAVVVLNGKQTLRATSGGNMLPTFYMIVPAQVDLPFLSKLSPDGQKPFEPSNSLSFVVTTIGATFPTNGIQVILDGNDVSPNLVITGSSSSNNVVYPALQPNAMHLAIINVTNSLGHGISITNQFDTFNQNFNPSVGAFICSNYMVEAEDYDYNGGQYFTSANYLPDCYAPETAFTNIDFHHIVNTNAGEPTDGSDFQYRIFSFGIPQQVITGDYYRPLFGGFDIDYELFWYAGGDWANYTRDYPPGTYNVYARTSGFGTFTMNFGQVVSGLGTTNQTVKALGQFSSTLPNINTFAWVPLTDSGGVAPVTVKIKGVTTFQLLTPTGNCYPNYFMLVPTSSIAASAVRSGNNINISFPTQTGWGYRVFYRTNLTTGSWALLNSTVGNGSVKSVIDPSPADNQRFYKVTSP